MATRTVIRSVVAVGVVAVAGLALGLLFWPRTPREKISEFGRYQGYSQNRFDGTKLVSDYLNLPDGKKLAYDLILPTTKGVVAAERLPVIFKYTPYLRTWTIFDKDGKNLIADFVELGWKERAFLRAALLAVSRGKVVRSLVQNPLAGEPGQGGLCRHCRGAAGNGGVLWRAQSGL